MSDLPNSGDQGIPAREGRSLRVSGTPSRKARTILPKKATVRMPSASFSDAGQEKFENHLVSAGVASLVEIIMANDKMRRRAMKARIKLEQALRSYLRSLYGWEYVEDDEEGDAPKALRAANKIANDKATKAVKVLFAHIAGKADWTSPDLTGIGLDIASEALPFATAIHAAQAPLVRLETEHTKAMTKAAEQLPVYQWVKSVKGFGAGNLAFIIAATGPLTPMLGLPGYSSVAKVWKRMGCAVMDGKRQGGLPKTAKDEEWIAHGYSPRRRAVAWLLAFGVMTKDHGVYRAVYDQYKARKVAEGAKHPHAMAQRYLGKRLLKHLWQAWREASYAVSERTMTSVPPAALSEAAIDDEFA